MSNLEDRLRGIKDSRSTRAIMSRGANVYSSTSHAANKKSMMVKVALERLKKRG